MTVELDEVRSFLAQHEPFSHLPEETLRELPRHMQIIYVRRGETVVDYGQVNDNLYIIRSGAVDILAEGAALIDRRDSGRNFGYSTLVDEPESRYAMVAVEDSILLVLPRAPFTQLITDNPDIKRFFESLSRRVAVHAHEINDPGNSDTLRMTVSDMIRMGNLVTARFDESIRATAVKMVEANVSSIVICGGAETGILTDRDLRKRVVAKGLDTSVQVAEVMTAPVRTIAPDTKLFEAMLILSELGIHHLPVTQDDQIVGVLTSSDVMHQLQSDPIYLAADVAGSSREELKDAYRRAAAVAARFLDRGSSAREVQQLLTSIADAIARRLAELAAEELGPAPVPYAFVAVGSQARREMGPASDQDNALVLDNSYNEAEHGDYFRRFTEFICTGLAEAGQALCPGEMMASQPQWRMTEDVWNATFHTWITAPESEALLNAQIFFDFRCLFGDEELAQRVHDNAVIAAHGSKRLHVHLAALATRREPPIGFFRGFVVERSGEYAATLDVKKGGTAAVVQMARLYTILASATDVGTQERIEASAGQSISPRGAEDLLRAYDYISNLALRHQANQVRAGDEPNYRIDPTQLSSIDRDALRDSFRIIKGLQSAMASKFPVRSI
ncbi:cyclic nucleotide-binding/CBS domain-containing protein [Corynebacterium sp. CCUG 69979]|uniref:DUF294 nucleotidyltransferase-like domain-containing protein n=1 Tax=Corynebacterium sp. CCUG 69979 TaxID=2823890 RepID=UPI00210AF3E3|nr:DUF294 nucleotidyltransferase-like domain-containing protein [Corynebacterium sp. CCUG 69979]MCQ4625066.1 cyclic nucleotide-binding/CBS domain-containing protein [Corynebacterium sp. CCUG 69979]